MQTLLTVEDMVPDVGDASPARLQSLVDRVCALARVVEPRLRDDVVPQHVLDGARAILQGAVERLVRSDSGTLQSQSEQVGPFGRSTSLDTRVSSAALTAGERADLLALYADTGASGAYSSTMLPATYWPDPTPQP